MPNWLRLLRRRYRVLRRLSWADWLLLLEAWLTLGLARFVVVVVPFRWVTPWLNQSCTESLGNGNAQRVGLALFYAARFTPWRSKCFEQALAGKLMLQRRHLPSTFYLGLAQEEVDLEAHAWLICQGQIVTGGQNVQRYRVVARFGVSGK